MNWRTVTIRALAVSAVCVLAFRAVAGHSVGAVPEVVRRNRVTVESLRATPSRDTSTDGGNRASGCISGTFHVRERRCAGVFTALLYILTRSAEEPPRRAMRNDERNCSDGESQSNRRCRINLGSIFLAEDQSRRHSLVEPSALTDG